MPDSRARRIPLVSAAIVLCASAALPLAGYAAPGAPVTTPSAARQISDSIHTNVKLALDRKTKAASKQAPVEDSNR